MKTTFTGDEFIKVLSEGSLKRPLIFTGMVKKSDEPTVILFAPGTSCQNWVSIKASYIEEVKWLGNVTCKDHSHEYVSLHFKDIEQVEPTLLVSLLKVYVEAYEISKTDKLVSQATASINSTSGLVRNSSQFGNPFAQTVQGCFYEPAAYDTCKLAGLKGIIDGRWTGYACNTPSIYCQNENGVYVLITNP